MHGAGHWQRDVADGVSGPEPQPRTDVRSGADPEAIAVIGMSCRLPGGVADPDAYWRLLRDKVDTVGPVPAARRRPGSREDQASGRPMSTLADMDRFEPEFFGISRREALVMDPQQRLLLELAWEAIERAAWSPAALAGSRTGVWVGIYSNDYSQERLYRTGTAERDGHAGLGLMRSLGAGRIAYHLDLRGPVMTLDTACSSSLLAIHAACRSLRAGECDRALAGGVNLALSPEITQALSTMGALSPSGRCRSFSADADGFVRGEGGGLVALKRLDEALADGDPIAAVIRGSAVNHDGRSNGIAAPNGSAQEAVIRAALADAGVDGGSVGYVETHGTGTALGDPIELRALGAAYGTTRAAPLVIGSVKTNLGHLEAAAGVAGFIKAALVVRHGDIPANLHFAAPNPLIPWDRINMAVPTETRPWPGRAPRRAGVSAFGMSGTNVHMIVEAPPPLAEAPCGRAGVPVVTLSARSETALRALVSRQAQSFAAMPTVNPAAFAASLNAGRAHFPWRVALVYRDRADLLDQLRRPQTATTAPSRAPDVAFRFSEAAAPLAQAADDRWPSHDEVMASLWETLTALSGAVAEDMPDDPGFQVFARLYASARVWQDWGVVPAQVHGAGIGGIAAACVAGIFDLADAVAILAARRRALAGADRDAGRFGFLKGVRSLRFAAPRCTFVSGMLGRAVEGELASPAYWWEQMWNAGPESESIAGEPGMLIIPIGLEGEDRFETGRRLAALYMAGVPVDWTRVHRGKGTRRLSLPTYPFERVRYFVEPQAPSRSDGLRGRPLPLAGTEDQRFDHRIGGAARAYLRNHRVDGRAILPAAAFAEIAVQSARAARPGSAVAIETLALLRALVLPDSAEPEMQTLVSGDGRWSLYARESGSEPAAAWTLHATGDVSTHATSPVSPPPGDDLGQTKAGAEIYAELARQGIDAGPAFRALSEVKWRGPFATAHAALPTTVDETEDYAIHPALFDACLVACSVILPTPPAGSFWMPAGFKRIVPHGAAGRRVRCDARLREGSGSGPPRVDLRIFGDDGGLVASVEGVAFVATRRSGLLQSTTSAGAALRILRPRWHPSPVLASAVSPQSFVIAGDKDWTGPLATALALAGHAVETVPEAASVDALHGVIASALAGGRSCGIVHLALGRADCGRDGIPAAYGLHLRLAQALARVSDRTSLQLDLVTRGSQRVGTEAVPGVAEAGLWGLSRVIAAEYPDLRQGRLDLDPDETAGPDAGALARHLLGMPGAEEVALRNGQRFVPSLSEADDSDPKPSVERPVFDGHAPGPGAVTIEVVASGLNFRDVLHARGLLPDSAARMPYGLECSGIVTAVGDGVVDLRPGMPVMAGLTVGSLADRVTVPVAFVVPKPARLSFRDAATLPLAFLTAHYALDRLARLRRGERVLIHAAAGAVGQAAIQVARRVGAEIYASASPGKWEHLRRQGVAHLFNSRLPGFAREIHNLTGRRGVDVVLNSLGGAAIGESFEALADGGRFVEIGKLEIWPPERVAALGRSIAYFPFDLWDVKQDASLVADMLAEMVSRLGDGTLTPLRSELFPVADLNAAVQYMARARHIGKIVLWQAAPGEGGLIDPNGSYLITGGLGALGLHAARWLASRGARHIMLVGRKAPDTATCEAIASIEARGAQVQTLQLDVANPKAVEDLFTRRLSHAPPLRGIIHAAGILDDGLIVHQTDERFEAVLRSKLRAAWLLHQASLSRPLDFFLIYASASGVFGTPGQGNYAAANAALDALAHSRAALGLPALAVDWGPWAGAGMAGRSIVDEAVGRIDPGEADLVLDRLMVERPGQVVVLPAVSQEVAATAPAARDRGSEERMLLTRLDTAPEGERLRLLKAHVSKLVAAALGWPAAQAIDTKRPLEELGFDSLMNIEIRVALNQALGTELRPTLTYDFPTIDAIAAHVSDAVRPRRPTSAASPDRPLPVSPDIEGELIGELRALNY